MVRLFTRAEAKTLRLPGRSAREIVSGERGSEQVSVRLVEIDPPQPGDVPRGPHIHDGFEECIYVLSGHGLTEAETGRFVVAAGDTILVPPGELHVTRNTGSEPLLLLCFFPVGEIASRTTEFADWDEARAAG